MIRRLIPGLIGLTLVTGAVVIAVVWQTCRIYVPENRCAVLIRKTGKNLPPGQKVATEPGQKGIQEQVLGPGRHFRNPYTWDWELKDLTVVPAGDPKTWEWVHSIDPRKRKHRWTTGDLSFGGEFPMVGVVTRRIGKTPPAGQVIVSRDSGYEGILEEVLTPGTYRLNPHIYQVDLFPATVIPAGFVGVVTNLFGDSPGAHGTAAAAASAPSADADVQVPPLAMPGQRGTLADVLQPGVYFINPKLQKILIIEIGYNEYSQLHVSPQEDLRIVFPSDTGYQISVGVTVVWGIHPQHAAQIINEFGNVDRVLDRVISPQLRSICRNVGSTFAARDFIQGEKREIFQKQLTEQLHRVCQHKNIDVLLALVREIEVHAPAGGTPGGSAPDDLKRTIQQSFIAVENQLTKEKQRDAAITKAKLEEARKKVDIAKEQIHAETGVMVANIQAEGEKEAAEIDARAALEVANIQQQVALLDAKRIEILGAANAEVEKMKKSAEAQGYRLLVQAFGSPKAYNLYTFAERFNPESIKLIFAGEGTFWTDLNRLDQVGTAKLLESGTRSTPPAK